LSPQAKAGRGAAKKAPAKKKPAKKAAKRAVPKVNAAELRIERFVSNYLMHFNGAKAARDAGFSADSARQQASMLLARPEIQARVREAQDAYLAKNEATKEMVLARMLAQATADPRAISELHRGCCRYCWGKDNLYQYKPSELREARAKWEAEATAGEGQGPPPEFDEGGGVGYNPKNDPNPACPECFGDGVERVVFKDTRDLPPDVAMLFEGVEVTQHGLKVRTSSPTDALLNVGKHLGMFAQKLKHVGGDEDDEPVQVGVVVVPPKTDHDGDQ